MGGTFALCRPTRRFNARLKSTQIERNQFDLMFTRSLPDIDLAQLGTLHVTVCTAARQARAACGANPATFKLFVISLA